MNLYLFVYGCNSFIIFFSLQKAKILKTVAVLISMNALTAVIIVAITQHAKMRLTTDFPVFAILATKCLHLANV